MISKLYLVSFTASLTVWARTSPELIFHEDRILEPEIMLQWNLSYPGSVGPRGARNFKIARNSEVIHELYICTYSTWLCKNTGHKYIKHKNVYMYGIRSIMSQAK